MPQKLPPGPRAPKTVQTMAWWNRPLAFLERCRARYGRRFTIRLLSTPPFVMIADPEQVREIFMAPPEVLHPGEGARILEPVVGRNSVILLDEREHLEQRKLMLPAFHGEKMQRLSALMADVAEREVAEWPRGEPIALHPRLQKLTLEVILRTVFGLDPGERLDGLRDRLTEILAIGAKPASMIPALQRDIGPAKEWSRFLQLREEADALLFELIEERRAEPDGRDDVLSMLLEARHEPDDSSAAESSEAGRRAGGKLEGSAMSQQELRDELMTLLVAGHETTASELAWAFDRVPREPAVMARLVEEIDSGDGDEYLTATVYETLRRRPVLPNPEPRLAVQPVTVGGWDYPPGVCLIANAYLIHHDPEIYPDPYAFRPERFVGTQPGTYTWIPFGGGRRRCLGASFSMVEMKIVLRTILAANEVRPVGDGFETPRRRSITISPRRGATAVVVPRRPTEAEPTEPAEPVAA